MTTKTSPDAPGGFLVAVAGREGGRIDQHFGQAEDFLIYRIASTGPTLVEQRSIAAHARDGEDRRETIVRMLKGCRMLLVAKVGVSPRAMLAEAGIAAIDRFSGQPVKAALAELSANPHHEGAPIP